MRGGFGRRISSGGEEDFDLSQLDREAASFLFGYLRRHRNKLVLALLAMMVVTLATLAGPYLTKLAVDRYIEQGNLAGLNLVLILMVASYGLFWFSSYWQTFLANWVGHRIVGEIRDDLYNHLHDLPVSFFESRKTGDVMARVTHDVDTLSDLVTTGFVNLLNDLFTLCGIASIMAVMDLKLALVSFAAIPVIFFSVSWLGKKIRTAQREVREKLAEINVEVEQNISGIRVVQALNREARNKEEFSRLSWQNLKANLKAAAFFSLLFPTMTFGRVLGEGLVLSYGGWSVLNGNISVGVLLAFLSYVRRFFAPLADLSQVYNTYQEAGAALDRITEYFAFSPHSRAKTDPKRAGAAKSKKKDYRGTFTFENVTFSYRDRAGEHNSPGKETPDEQEGPVLEDFKLTVEAGEHFSLVGPTGAGKTTVANLLAGLYEPDRGRVMIDGIALEDIPDPLLRQLVGVAPQDVFLFDASIKDNLQLGNLAAGEAEIKEVAKQIGVHEFISRLPQSYQTRVGEEGVKLSGGQKQLISLTRAALVDPQILILDEATSSMDAHTEMLVKKAMQKLLSGKTALTIAHRFSTLQNADRIGVMREGQLLAVGNHQELLDISPLYSDLVQRQKNQNR
ncbi:MAG: ABC transporter ATP-binding protein [Candidatus Acetothermia bacterium]